MPFVVVSVPAVDIPSWMTSKVQKTCKTVWESMSGVSTPNEELLPTDVGGVVVRTDNSESILSLQFIYNERADEFDRVLHARLHKVVTATLAENLQNPKVLQSKYVEIQTTPTQSDHWFEDPTWATKVEKCTKCHANEVSDLHPSPLAPDTPLWE